MGPTRPALRRPLAVLAVALLTAGAMAVATAAGGASGLTPGKVKSISKKQAKKVVKSLGPTLFASSSEFKPFSAVLDQDGAEAPLLTHGPLRVFARCDIDEGGFDLARVFADSTVTWYDDDSLANENAPNTPESIWGVGFATGGDFYTNQINRGSVVAREGDTIYRIGLEADTLGIGFNVFGHRCYVAGAAFLTTTSA